MQQRHSPRHAERACAMLLSLLLAVECANAHRLSSSDTDIVWQPDDRALEVTHRWHLDDALWVLAQLGKPNGGLDLEAQARLIRYVGRRFRLASRRGPLTLEPMGVQVDGSWLFIYQRCRVESLPEALEIRNSMLRDNNDQRPLHLVNYRVGGLVRSSHGEARDHPVWLLLSGTDGSD